MIWILNLDLKFWIKCVRNSRRESKSNIAIRPHVHGRHLALSNTTIIQKQFDFKIQKCNFWITNFQIFNFLFYVYFQNILQSEPQTVWLLENNRRIIHLRIRHAVCGSLLRHSIEDKQVYIKSNSKKVNENIILTNKKIIS